MAAPTPTPGQNAALQQGKLLADAGVTGSDDKIAAVQGAIDQQQEIEDFMKSSFDYYDTGIIRNYELERRYIDGQIVTNPIVEQDLLDFIGKDATKRLWNNNQFEPLRIDEFDGLPLSVTDDINEQDQFLKQDQILDGLKNGYAGQITLDASAETSSSLDSSSTTLQLQSDEEETINPNDLILILTATDFAIVKVLSVSASGGSCSNPLYTTKVDCELNLETWTPGPIDLDIEFIIEPSGTIPTGTPAGQETFSGFSNAERTSKISSNGALQIIIDSLLSKLQTSLENRKSALENELLSIQNNQNENINPIAETNVQTSISAIDGFLGLTPPSTIDISDVGITAMNTEESTRQGQISLRIPEIGTEINSGDFYNKRYNFTSGRCHLANGSLTLIIELNAAKAGFADGKVLAQGLADRYNDLIV